MIRNRKILTLLFILTTGAFGCSNTGDEEAIFAPTEVGTPEGLKVTKEIGSAGGTLASPDGRLTLTVPPNALTETIAFSIQPITNKAGNGIGLAYRLEPDGKTFATPLQISVRYDDKDLVGTVPEALLLAYQDQQGAWHEVKSLNQTEDTLTVATTHFTDWSFLAKMRLEPTKATLGVGKTLYIALIGCKQKEPTFADRFRRTVFGTTWNDGTPIEKEQCRFGEVNEANFEWFVDIGTVESGTNPVKYTAPPKKPNPNIATVVFPYSVADTRNCLTGECDKQARKEAKRGVFTSHITIVDRGYRASGRSGHVEFTGVICSLDQPFTISGAPWFDKTMDLKFVPANGTWSCYQKYRTLTSLGSGTYTLEGAGTDKPKLLVEGTGTSIVTGVGQFTRTYPSLFSFDLTPLETNECVGE